MTFQQLRHFLAIIETGNLSRAAQRCHISQPSMSASLKALESDLDCQLFKRHAKGLLPTEAGRKLQQHASRLLDEAHLARQSLKARTALPTGELRLGVTETISAYLLAQMFRWRSGVFGSITLQIEEGSVESIQQKLRAGEIDLALMVTDNVEPGGDLRLDELFVTPRRLWAPAGHPLLRQPEIALSDVCRYPFVLLEMDDHVKTWKRYWQAQPRQPEIVLRSHSIEAVRNWVGSGLGITILSDLIFRPWSLDGDHLSRRELTEPVPGMQIGFLSRNAGCSSLAGHFVTRLRAAVQEYGWLAH